MEATCQCLLAQAEEAERLRKTSAETEGLVLEEFGRCLLQIIEYASKAKGIIMSLSGCLLIEITLKTMCTN